jgi:CO/xanthine dehydrogenase FAD-binding subunit
MCELLPEHRRVLRDYFMASSVEEAIAYLTAHPGEAQIIGGGTKLMPLLQRGEASATRLVDVSRISAMKRVRIEGDYLLIGGAVTYAQLLIKEIVAEQMPILAEAAQMLASSRLRQQASLAGSVVHARSNSEGAVVLIALGAEAEIANLTGAQWVPVRALFVRPGVSRVDSAAEIVTAVRIPLLGAGQGTALARIEPAEGEEHSPLIAAVALGLTEDDELDWLSLALGAPATLPQLWHLNDLTNGHPIASSNLRQQIVSATLQAGGPASDDESSDPEAASTTILAAYDRALQRAHAARTP